MANATLTDAIREAYAVASTDVIVYHTLEINHATFAEPVRIVQGWDAIAATLEADAPRDASTEVAFIPMGFEFQPPGVRENELPSLEIRIYDASKLLMDPIEAAADAATPIEVLYRPYVSTDFAQPAMSPIPLMHLTQIHVDEMMVSATAVFLDVLNRVFPRGRYTLAEFPGLAA